ncbi:MAG: efflux RND transporter periplasmic adaptor subunit [Melioribacteraceae bacterium]|nr:efflux RND transporter periplasmic adaptor subunit [Melioribacteraceae bacterium]
MKKAKLYAIPVLIVIVIVAVLFYNKSKMQAKAAPKVTDVFYVSVQPVSSNSLSEDISLIGTVNADKDVNIVSETQGKVVAVNTKVGDYKQVGSILIQVDDELKKAAFMSAEANFEKSKKDFERYTVLLKQGSATDAQMDNIKLQLANAESQYIVARKQLSDTKITTPISGYVTARNVDIGTMVNPGMVIGNVVDISKVKVKVNVAEQDVFKIKTGNKVEVTTDVFPGTVFEGRIETISSKADEVHTYPIEVAVYNNGAQKLKAGMFAKVSFSTSTKEGSLTIPREALLGSVKEPEVYVVENDIAKLRKLVLGEEAGVRVEVLDGLQSGEKVVVSGQTNLEDNVKVKIVN